MAKAQGKSIKEMAEMFGLSPRYISTLLSRAKLDGSGTLVLIPEARENADLSPEVQERVEFSADGFEKFFNAYSGRTLQPIHKEWVARALGSRRVLINCPPRHAKSTIFSVWFPLWLVAMDRDVQILICSQTDKLAKKFTNEIAYHLIYNPELIADFGRFKPEMGDWPWRPNSGELLVDGRHREFKSGDLTVQVRGAGQAILGMEANWVIVDDPVDRPTAMSEAQRATLSEWFHGDVMTRLEVSNKANNTGRAVVIGQRLHTFDLYGELSGEKITKTGAQDWEHLNYKAILDWEAQETLWPEKWDFDSLMQVYQDVGEDLFESMYQQNPLRDSRRLARHDWLYGNSDLGHLGCIDVDRIVGEGTREDSPLRTVRALSIDPSPTRYAGLVVADVPREDSGIFRCDVLELRREKMSVRDMLENIDRCIALYNPDYFIFEQVAAQRWFLQDREMERIRQRLTVLPHTTNRNKADPTLGVESLALDFEFGRIRFPYGDAESKQMSELLFDEARTWPQGMTDDLLMALWFIKYNYIRMSPRGNLTASNEAQKRNIPPRLLRGWSWMQPSKPRRTETWRPF